MTSEFTVRPRVTPSYPGFRAIPETLVDTELNRLQSDAVVSVEVVDRTRAQSKS